MKKTDRESIRKSFENVTNRKPTDAELDHAVSGIHKMAAAQTRIIELLTEIEKFPPAAVALLATTADTIIGQYYSSENVPEEHKRKMTKMLREDANKSLKYVLFIV